MRASDILKELEDDARIIPDGVYLGRVMDIEWGTTRTRGSPYLRLAVRLVPDDHLVHVFVAYTITQYPLLKFTADMLKKYQAVVRVKVSHIDRGDHILLDTRLIGVGTNEQSSSLQDQG